MSRYSDSLMRSVVASELGSLAEEYAELGVDSLVDNELIKILPVAKTIAGVARIGFDIRDRNYIKKILKFLFQVNNVSEEVKEKFKKELDSQPSEILRAGETVWEILDSINSSEKAVYIGKIFQSYMNGEISVDRLTHLCEIVDRVYLGDLLTLKEGAVSTSNNRDNLISVGIYEPVDIMAVVDEFAGERRQGLTPGNPQRWQNTPLTESGGELVRILKNY